MKADISTKGKISSPKERVFIDFSNSLYQNDNSSFQKKSVNTPKHRQSTTTAHPETQYADYMKKGIHEKLSLLNSKLTCVKKSSDDIKVSHQYIYAYVYLYEL